MLPNPKQLVVEHEGYRETYCKIVGTREGLLLLAQDLTAAAQKMPESVDIAGNLDLPGWQQHIIEAHSDGFAFAAVPDLDAYLEKRKGANRNWTLLMIVMCCVFMALLLIGLRTVWMWIF